MEEFINKIQDEMNTFDKEYLRKIQGDAYRCAAKCCDNEDLSHDNLQRCVEKCTRPVQSADRYMQEEMQNLHDRFQRCAMSCADKIKDKASPDADKAQYKAEMEACVQTCSDEMVRLIPQLSKRMHDWFKSKKYSN